MPDPPGPFCPLSAEQLDAVVSCGANQPAVGTHHDGFGALSLEYDSIDPRSSVREGAFRRLDPAVACEDSGTWKTARWTIRGGRFADRRNGRDFRPAVTQGELAVRRITASQIESSQKQRRHCRPGRVPAN